MNDRGIYSFIRKVMAPTGNRDSGDVCTATGKRVYSEATAVYGIRRNHLDQQHHMARIINIITVVNKK